MLGPKRALSAEIGVALHALWENSTHFLSVRWGKFQNAATMRSHLLLPSVKLHTIPVCFLVKTRTTALKDEIFEEVGRELIPDLFMTFICEFPLTIFKLLKGSHNVVSRWPGLLTRLTHAEPLHIAAAAGTSSVLAWITVVLRSNLPELEGHRTRRRPRQSFWLGLAMDPRLDLLSGDSCKTCHKGKSPRLELRHSPFHSGRRQHGQDWR